MNRFLLLALFGCVSPTICPAQDTISIQVLASAGKSAVQGGRYYAYTVGESVVATLQGATHLTQGFHQPELYLLPVATSDLELATWNIEVFPNPTSDFLHIRYDAPSNRHLEAMVFDVLGHLIVTNTVFNQPDDSLLDCTSWPAGIYFLQLRDPATKAIANVRFIRL